MPHCRRCHRRYHLFSRHQRCRVCLLTFKDLGNIADRVPLPAQLGQDIAREQSTGLRRWTRNLLRSTNNSSAVVAGTSIPDDIAPPDTCNKSARYATMESAVRSNPARRDGTGSYAVTGRSCRSLALSAQFRLLRRIFDVRGPDSSPLAGAGRFGAGDRAGRPGPSLAEGRRLIHENGITYNVYGDPQSTDRPWPLDPIPLLIDHREWAAIEAGHHPARRPAQRASSADLYGPQRLLREDLLPPELVFRQPGFLRPCRGVRRARRHLSAHLRGRPGALARRPLVGDCRPHAGAVRAPVMRWRTGWSRRACCRTSSAPPRCSGWRIFFQTYRETLRAPAPPSRENPRIVLLTPGPYNETYFEHAYLARYLGFTLVEGGDLTVRDTASSSRRWAACSRWT